MKPAVSRTTAVTVMLLLVVATAAGTFLLAQSQAATRTVTLPGTTTTVTSGTASTETSTVTNTVTLQPSTTTLTETVAQSTTTAELTPVLSEASFMSSPDEVNSTDPTWTVTFKLSNVTVTPGTLSPAWVYIVLPTQWGTKATFGLGNVIPIAAVTVNGTEVAPSTVLAVGDDLSVQSASVGSGGLMVGSQVLLGPGILPSFFVASATTLKTIGINVGPYLELSQSNGSSLVSVVISGQYRTSNGTVDEVGNVNPAVSGAVPLTVVLSSGIPADNRFLMVSASFSLPPTSGQGPTSLLIIPPPGGGGGGGTTTSTSSGPPPVSFGPSDWGVRGQNFAFDLPSTSAGGNCAATSSSSLCVGSTSQPELYSDTPCLYDSVGCTGSSLGVTYDSYDGLMMSSVLSDGIAGQSASTMLGAYFRTPNATDTQYDDYLSPSVTVYSILMAGTAGFFANTGATAFQVSVDLGPCGSYTQTPSVSTSVTIGVPGESDEAQALENLEGPLQTQVENALSGQASTQQAIQTGFDDFASLEGIPTPTLYVSSFPAPSGCEETSGWTNSYTVQTYLLAANSGVGASYGLAVSYVQLSIGGQEVVPYTPPTPTSLKLSLSTSQTNFDQPFRATVQVQQCSLELFGYCLLYESLQSTPAYPNNIISVTYPSVYGGMLGSADCILSGDSCTVNFAPDSVQSGYDTLIAYWGGVPASGGSPGLAQSVDSAKIGIAPGASDTTLKFPYGNSATVGEQVVLDADVSAQNGLFSSVSGGTVTFTEEPQGSSNGTYIGTCSVVGNGCSAFWTPATAGSFTLSAAWTGNIDLIGSVSNGQSFVVSSKPIALSVVVGAVAKGSFSCVSGSKCISSASAGFNAIEISANGYAPGENLVISTPGVDNWACSNTSTCTDTGFYKVLTNSTGGFQAASYCSFTDTSGCDQGQGAATVTQGDYEVTVCDTSGDCASQTIIITDPPPANPGTQQSSASGSPTLGMAEIALILVVQAHRPAGARSSFECRAEVSELRGEVDGTSTLARSQRGFCNSHDV